MRKTDIIWTCPHCREEFELFCDDGTDDRTLLWNWCPHCGKKVDVWIRFKQPNEQILLGLSAKEAREKFALNRGKTQ